MPRDARTYLYDIREACELLQSFTEGKSFEDYQQDPLLRSAVERQFEIIGEALNQAIKLEPSIDEYISESRRIVDFRNQLIHAYHLISGRVVWGILKGRMPTLKEEVESLLHEDQGPL